MVRRVDHWNTIAVFARKILVRSNRPEGVACVWRRPTGTNLDRATGEFDLVTDSVRIHPVSWCERIDENSNARSGRAREFECKETQERLASAIVINNLELRRGTHAVVIAGKHVAIGQPQNRRKLANNRQQVFVGDVYACAVHVHDDAGKQNEHKHRLQARSKNTKKDDEKKKNVILLSAWRVVRCELPYEQLMHR
jgi:hypothetical protein